MNDTPIGGDSSDPAAHDVLAAEEFALPAPDPSIGHPPVVLPEDPSGIAEPHDILAAEEFALPACPPNPSGLFPGSVRGGWQPAAILAGVIGLLLAGRVLRARRSR
ncbi:MAG TPA: hypothetical protein VG186_00365 [Solirubrobacteraceae bacterium]|nr:hypothetical protein [Solirubrobacteraceae bacterium]